MALCAYHEDIEAGSTCVTCKSPICDVCKEYGADGMCGMCLEVSNARKANLDHARAAARTVEGTSAEDASEDDRAGEGAGRPRPAPAPTERAPREGSLARPSGVKGPTREQAVPRSPSRSLRGSNTPEPTPRGRGTSKLEAQTGGSQPAVRRLTPKQRRQRRALVAGGVTLLLGFAVWLVAAPSADPGEPSEETVLELRQRMGLVKSVVLSVRERTGVLPDSLQPVEAELRRREFDPNALSPPLRIVMDRKTSWPLAVVIRTRPKGLELSATDQKGRPVQINGQPLLMEVPALSGNTGPAGQSPAPTPTPALGDVKMDS